jgi:hypothetical protein
MIIEVNNQSRRPTSDRSASERRQARLAIPSALRDQAVYLAGSAQAWCGLGACRHGGFRRRQSESSRLDDECGRIRHASISHRPLDRFCFGERHYEVSHQIYRLIA